MLSVSFLSALGLLQFSSGNPAHYVHPVLLSQLARGRPERPNDEGEPSWLLQCARYVLGAQPGDRPQPKTTALGMQSWASEGERSCLLAISSRHKTRFPTCAPDKEGLGSGINSHLAYRVLD